MLTKEHYEQTKKLLELAGWAVRLHECAHIAIAEYESANPPKPEVKCPACGGKMSYYEYAQFWGCDDVEGCDMDGPRHDPDGSKVTALGKRKLPIKPPFVVAVNKKAIACTSIEGMGHKMLGDPIDLSDWF